MPLRDDHYERYVETSAPGVYVERQFSLPGRAPFCTGVPLFIGHGSRWSAAQQEAPLPQLLTAWPQYEEHFGPPPAGGYLSYAVRGFFENGGKMCYVANLHQWHESESPLAPVLEAAETLASVDLICTPGLHVGYRAELRVLHQTMVDFADRSGRHFVLMDSMPGDSNEAAAQHWYEVNGDNGALYYPWIKVRSWDGEGGVALVPPCGHIAGVYARTDATRGVHKAPANELLLGVFDLEHPVTQADQDYLNPMRVNCLRALPGRGIRIWGARTISNQRAWMFVNVRRLFLTAVRWIEWHMWDIAFEPNNRALWSRIERELTSYFTEQYRRGALRGRTPREAFYVRCDEETNPEAVRETGRVVTEVGFAPTSPFEFVIVRLVHGPHGVTISGPERAAEPAMEV